MTFRILFVCTGNVCRSPMAELMTRAWADPSADVRVGSAGVEALVGAGVDAPSARALAGRGIDAAGHRARQFEPGMTTEADLVLVAETWHRDLVLTQVPRALRRTFTLREFARLADGLAPGEPVGTVARVAALRGGQEPPEPEADEVPDPYRASDERAEAVARVVADAVGVTLLVLGLAAPPPRPAAAARPRPRSAPTPPRPAPVRPPAPASSSPRPAPVPSPPAAPAAAPARPAPASTPAPKPAPAPGPVGATSLRPMPGPPSRPAPRPARDPK